MPKQSVEAVDRVRRPETFVIEEEAWDFVRSLLGRHSSPRTPRITVDAESGAWMATAGVSAEAKRILDLCVPLCVGPRMEELVVAHLGQSLDGRVATPPGAPRLITGAEDHRHTHRLRALSDAVVVGATTAVVDDPELTTRYVPGDLPTRVVLDPAGRCPHGLRLFSDGKAPTMVLVGLEWADRHAALPASVEVVPLALSDGSIPIRDVLRTLADRGLRRVFVEGGGVTVSRFLEAGAVDRLHVAVASKIIGTGAPALQLGGLGAAFYSTAPARTYLLGTDVLFDCDLRAPGGGRGVT
jgi:diaminohydroxyphosphoribosylaminopyrimidine deaminase/5-amino-6-(5-phosphoribosylamino)uracil reductase